MCVVLKPPGGASSNLFGEETPQEQTPRRVKNYMKSSIFGSEEDSVDSPASAKSRPRPGNDSVSQLFGGQESKSSRPVKNYLKSSIFAWDESDAGKKEKEKKEDEEEGKEKGNEGGGKLEQGDSVHDDAAPQVNTQVNGEVYQNGHGHGNGSINGDTNGYKTPPSEPSTPTSAAPGIQQRGRVPPGGFSSKLW
ncbi:unnamed protein product [Darwinula stevensoni]|uniref:Microtubule-associated protein Jupiter n=1 Tax=Darwinula stevensoni TaxID=69355 RepID=A0A7R9A941_9CRUS|nr:unnamed protein product [Darwinula stevensoni]CAG0897082.1 unnamed protein product [Darwinula stevensoni]